MTDQLILDEGKNFIPSLLQQVVFMENLFVKLNAVDTLISSMDNDIIEKTNGKEFRKWLHINYLKNVEFMRQLKIYVRISEQTETALEYFGQDFLTHQEFVFDEEFEKKLSFLNRKLNHFIGTLLRETNKADTFEI